MEYLKLAETYKRLEAFSEKTEKTHILARFLKEVPDDELKIVLLLVQGQVFYPWEEKKLGVGEKLLIRALALASGIPKNEIEKLLTKLGDIGLVAERVIKAKKQVTLFKKTLTVKYVYETLRKIGELEGEGTIDKKIKYLTELLINASPLEAKYLSRMILEELRIGVGEGIIRDAIAEAYNVSPELVEYAYSLLNDFGEVAEIARKEGEEGLKKVKLIPGRPIRVMLAIKVENVREAFETVGKPAAVEYKYDGFRVQIHKNREGKIELWTRRLENVTKQFPDVVEYVRQYIKGEEFVVEGEVVGFDKKTGKFLPFQRISQRIKRKYDIEKMAKEIPVEVHLFDLVYLNGKMYMDSPYRERRKLLKEIVDECEGKIVLAKSIITDSEEEAQRFYQEALNKGLEGVMFKNLDAPYKPGRRVGYMVKLKPVMETLDLVIIGAEWGEGKRAGWLTSFRIACRDPVTGRYLTVGEVGTGIKEKKEAPEDITFEELTETLKPYIIKEEGKTVKIKPFLVVEVAYEEIQKSPRYESGFALRFPRIVRIRYDRGPEEVDTIDRVKELYLKQRGGQHL